MLIFIYKALPVKTLPFLRSSSAPGWRLALLGAGVLPGCTDLIEPDIRQEPVVLMAPGPAARSTTVVQRFQWAAVPNARTYRFQLAVPGFTGTTRLVLDTVVRQLALTHTLAPGRYEWRVQAANAGYQTAFTTRALTIDSTGSLVGQLVQLGAPTAGFATNAATLSFSWSRLPMAQQYRLSVTPNPRGATLAPLDSLVGAATSVTLRLARQSQAYQWKVTALNATGQAVSAAQSFEVDLTPPPAPTLLAPSAAASFLTLPIALSWSRAAADVVQDSVFIYRIDQTTLFTNYPRLSSSSGLTLASPSTPLVTGTYYWAVRSVDRAGNLSPLSAKRAFVLQ